MNARILQIDTKCSDDIRALLTENVLGTPGQSMVYQQLRTLDKLSHIPDPYFAKIRRQNSTLATCCFCKRQTTLSTVFYARYFSFKQSLRSTGLLHERKEKKSIIRDEILELLSGQPFDTEDAVFYAYLDPKNVRSVRLCYDFGFEQIRTFSTLTFSRLFPKKDALCQKATKDDFQEIQSILRKEYANYTFYTEENLFYEGNYFIKKDKHGQIIAGIQANPEHWKIASLPGALGKILLSAVSHLPLLGRLINRDFRFAAFDYCFGSATDLASLMESALAQQNVYSGLISLDNRSDIYFKLKTIRLGLLHKLKKEVKATVIAKHTVNNEENLTNFRKQPSFISTMDLT